MKHLVTAVSRTIDFIHGGIEVFHRGVKIEDREILVKSLSLDTLSFLFSELNLICSPGPAFIVVRSFMQECGKTLEMTK